MKKRNTFIAPLKSKDTHLHIDPIKCYGCNELYSLTVRDDPFDHVKKYCANCFAHIYNLADYELVLRSLTPIQQTMWETPTANLPQEALDLLPRNKKNIS